VNQLQLGSARCGAASTEDSHQRQTLTGY
jgi:hypothetical protein